MASINNMLPGSRRSVPYIVDTSECGWPFCGTCPDRGLVILFWKMIELNKVRGSDHIPTLRNFEPIPPSLQKFRTYLLEQDKSMDILVYFLCYFLEIKDKPGNERALITTPVSVLIQSGRTTRALSSVVLHHSDALRRTFLRPTAHIPDQVRTHTCKVECWWRYGRFYDQRACLCLRCLGHSYSFCRPSTT